MSGWSWDTRLSCVCSSFGADFDKAAFAAIARVFPDKFDARTIHKAPPLIQTTVQQTGNLRVDQFVFGTRTVGDTLAFGLWWPWGDDVTISFRIGLAGHFAHYELANLRSEFNAE